MERPPDRRLSLSPPWPFQRDSKPIGTAGRPRTVHPLGAATMGGVAGRAARLFAGLEGRARAEAQRRRGRGGGKRLRGRPRTPDRAGTQGRCKGAEARRMRVFPTMERLRLERRIRTQRPGPPPSGPDGKGGGATATPWRPLGTPLRLCVSASLRLCARHPADDYGDHGRFVMHVHA